MRQGEENEHDCMSCFFFFFFQDLPDLLPLGLIIAGFRYGVSGDGFWCCRWFEVDGVWLILSLIFGFVRWVSVGFGSISVGVWLVVGCRVAHGGFMGWLAMVVPIFDRFWWFWV